jgi:monofunctional biosynthetic peptidoglycan transglycosylase
MRHRAAKVAVGLPAASLAYFFYLYLTLPDVRPLATANPPTTAFIDLRAAEARAAGQKPRRVQRWMRYEAISNNLRRAVLVAEDDAFWQHDGVDVEQLRKSIESNLEKGKIARGGSTITQQLAKNLYLSPSKNPIRKLREFLIARRLEAALSKRRIFEIYLNVIEWGDGVYGADAAARRYFGKSAGALSPEEAALMAGAIINPRVHNPAHPTARLRVRQQIILKRMGWVEPPPEAPEIPAPTSPSIAPIPQLPSPHEDGPLPEPSPEPSQPPQEPPLEETPPDQPAQEPSEQDPMPAERPTPPGDISTLIRCHCIDDNRQLIRETVRRSAAEDRDRRGVEIVTGQASSRHFDANLTPTMSTAISKLDRETRTLHVVSGERLFGQVMINYTDQITRLMHDIVRRVPQLGHIDMSRVLVFARFGRSDAEGAYATCHAINLPTSEPSYYFWRDRQTGEMTRRSEWFITKSPLVERGSSSIDYLISFCLPRFCDQTIARAHKEESYPGAPPWVAKLDTIVHELYHIDPTMQGIRKLPSTNGKSTTRTHSPEFFEDVIAMTNAYLASGVDPELLEFLKYDFEGLTRKYGRVTGTAFRSFPSYPQRYVEVLTDQPVIEPGVRVEPVRAAASRARYTDEDLDVREFGSRASRRLVRPRQEPDRPQRAA